MGKKASNKNKEQDIKIKEQEAALKKNKDLDDKQTVNIVNNAEKIEKIKETAADDFRANKAKDKDQDDEIKLNTVHDRMRYAEIKHDINVKFGIAIVFALTAIAVALFL
jgi:hypothetical protein